MVTAPFCFAMGLVLWTVQDVLVVFFTGLQQTSPLDAAPSQVIMHTQLN
jgi:hypothetical protein